MADIHLLPLRPNRHGVEHLVRDLKHVLSSGAPSDPRWGQMSACGLGLQHLCDDLRKAIDEMSLELASTPEGKDFCASLYKMAESFIRLGAAAQKSENITYRQIDIDGN